jgi:dihydroxyacetone kinase phosphotransfer subunit
VVVSHSRALGEAAAELGREVLQGEDVRVEVAAGLDDGALGTDAAAILEALERAEQGSGVVVLMDLGSAVLSAELALELLDEATRDRVVLSPAPLVEGLVAACVAAAGGADRDTVAAEALAGLAGKQAHLGAPAPPGSREHLGAAPPAPDLVTAFVTVTPRHGLHARPAARLVQTARGAQVPVEVRNATTGSDWVPATSMAQVAVLGVLSGHELELRAAGPGAREAVDALVALADRAFDEPPATPPTPVPASAQAPRVPADDSAPAGDASSGVATGPAGSRRPDSGSA